MKQSTLLFICILVIGVPFRASSEISINQFENTTVESGISYIGPSWGSLWGDFNGDSLPDVWFVNHYYVPSLYINQGDGSFLDIADEVFTEEFPEQYDAHGAAWADFDKDGDQDLYLLADEGGGHIPAMLFVNENGQFTEMAAEYGLEYTEGRGRTPMWLDYNRDGLIDVMHPTLRRWDGNDLPPALFEQGEFGFTDVSDEVGLIDNGSMDSHYVELADLNGDGIPELLIHQNGFPRNVYDMSSGVLVDVKETWNVPHTHEVVDSVIGDFDGDLDNDIFFVRGEKTCDIVQVTDNRLEVHTLGQSEDQGLSFRTTGDVTFDFYPGWLWLPEVIFIGSSGINPTTMPFTLSTDDETVWGIQEHVPNTGNKMYVGYDPDSETWQILHSVNQANIIIESTLPITEIASINWDMFELPTCDRIIFNNGSSWQISSEGLIPSSGRSVVSGDFDNDMDLDIYVNGTGPVANLPNTFYENDGNGNFSVVANGAGAAGTDLGKGDGVSTVDYDMDGFLDLINTNGMSKAPWDDDGPYEVFRNMGNANHWLEINLIGIDSNRDAVGAQLIATAGGVQQYREQNSGMHHRGQNHQRIHFGLGSNTIVSELRILWPNGLIQIMNDIDSDQIIDVEEPVLSVEIEPELPPIQSRKLGCFPNPFNPGTTIVFSLDKPQLVKLSIYDTTGRLVHRIVQDEYYPAGEHEFTWNGKDDSGTKVSSGVYFLRLDSGIVPQIIKIVLLK